MSIRSRIRGPRLGTKLALLGTALLVIPWLSYLLLQEMERLLVRMQSHQQQLMAESIATSFHGRGELFSDLPVNPEEYEFLYAEPIAATVRLDGRLSDWGEVSTRAPLRFGDGTDSAFALSLGQHGGFLYAHLAINDDHHVYRDPEFLRLSSADHLRVNYWRSDGTQARIAVTASSPGFMTAYETGDDWQTAETGAPYNDLRAYLRPTDDGMAIEFRLPLVELESRRFGISFVDVDDEQTRNVETVVHALPTGDKDAFDLRVLRSPELLDIIEGLGYSGARILVIDAERRIRAESGSYRSNETEDPTEPTWIEGAQAALRSVGAALASLERWFDVTVLGNPEPIEDPTAQVNEVIERALAGEPVSRRQFNEAEEVIFAGHPIRDNDVVIGLIAVEQNIDQILKFQRQAIDKVVLYSILSLIAGFLALLAFSGRLAWRIRHLRREANAAIDQHGRLTSDTLTRDVHAGDEIGDLARSIESMLTRLQQHNTFLESMPRTLRHEINNPLNTLSTSLQNLANESEAVRDSKYLESAKRGLLRIGAIVQNLADAANLEESLGAEDLEVIDINELIESYVNNCKLTHTEHEFVFRGAGRPVLAEVADYRIEQLLDKIVDNAIDFHRTNSPIKVQVDAYHDFLQISIANRGPTLPPDAANSLFESMVSRRGPDNRLHFGIGLYVVRVIAEHHGGSVRAMNLVDGSGVAFMIRLPLAEEAVAPDQPVVTARQVDSVKRASRASSPSHSTTPRSTRYCIEANTLRPAAG